MARILPQTHIFMNLTDLYTEFSMPTLTKETGPSGVTSPFTEVPINKLLKEKPSGDWNLEETTTIPVAQVQHLVENIQYFQFALSVV